MNREQFLKIRYFDPEEIEHTGATLDGVQLRLMKSLDEFRDAIACPVRIVKNGLTTGEHGSPEHGEGLAADITLADFRPVNVIVNLALDCGFDAIGVYHNSLTYSYHLGIRGKHAAWMGVKEHHGKWSYRTLFVDPAKVAV